MQPSPTAALTVQLTNLRGGRSTGEVERLHRPQAAGALAQLMARKGLHQR